LPAKRVKRGRQNQQDHDQSIGKRVVAEILDRGKNLHRGDTVVIEDQRHAQFGKGPDEGDRGAGEKPGHDQGQGDPPQPPPGRRPQVGGRLFQCGIEIGQRRRDIQVDDGIEVKHVHEHHARHPPFPQPVDGLIGGDEAQQNQQAVQGAGLSQDGLDPQRADEGRQDQRRQQQAIAQPPSGKFVTHIAKSQGHGE